MEGKISTKEELLEHKREYSRKYRKKHKEEIKKYRIKWYQKNKRRKTERNREKAREYQIKWRKEHPGYQKEYHKNIKERNINKMSLNKSIEFLEKLKDKKGIDTEVVNQMQKEVKTLDEALLLDLKLLEKKLYKPIRKVWVVAIKSINEEEIDQYEEMLNETMNRGKTIFPKSMLTISLLRDGSGKLKAINFKKNN